MASLEDLRRRRDDIRGEMEHTVKLMQSLEGDIDANRPGADAKRNQLRELRTKLGELRQQMRDVMEATGYAAAPASGSSSSVAASAPASSAPAASTPTPTPAARRELYASPSTTNTRRTSPGRRRDESTRYGQLNESAASTYSTRERSPRGDHARSATVQRSSGYGAASFSNPSYRRSPSRHNTASSRHATNSAPIGPASEAVLRDLQEQQQREKAALREDFERAMASMEQRHGIEMEQAERQAQMEAEQMRAIEDAERKLEDARRGLDQLRRETTPANTGRAGNKAPEAQGFRSRWN